MKLSLLQENLNTALTHVSRFTSLKAQLPILSHLLLSTDNGRLKLSATNLELGLNYWIGAKIDTEGSLTLPAREITEFISYLNPGKIDLTLDGNLLKVISPKSESSFAITPSSDFPEIPTLDASTAFDLDLSLLNLAINQIAFAAATDDTRPVLTAIFCKFEEDTLTLAATDGFRLSVKNLKLTNPTKTNTLLIPARSLSEVVKLSKTAKTIRLGLTSDQHQVVFVLEDLELVSRLIEGDYPDYHRIIPPSFATKISLNKSEFSQAIKIASVFAKESANVVKISVKANGLELSANAPQIGQNRVTVDAKIEGDPLEIAFNYKFISDFLSITQSDNITLELNEPLTPGVFRDTSDPTFFHVIMPVRIQD